MTPTYENTTWASNNITVAAYHDTSVTISASTISMAWTPTPTPAHRHYGGTGGWGYGSNVTWTNTTASTWSNTLTADDWVQQARNARRAGRGGWNISAYERPVIASPDSPEQRAHREQVRAAFRQRVDAANTRARDLLLSCLTTDQREQFEREKLFRVVSNKGNIFEITERRMHNVFRLNDVGQRIEEWCVTPYGDIPVCDVLLAQKLCLEADEDDLAERSNITLLASYQMVRRARQQYDGRQADYLRLSS